MLQTLDSGLFRFINQRLSNPIFDGVMPFLSGNPYFLPALVLLGMLLLWKGGARGRLCVLMLALILALGDSFVTNTIKHAIGRERPFLVFPEAHCLVGKGGSGSMPSSHAANWFAATFVAFIYYRRSFWFMLPMALLVGFSRIYNGVHYPSDVLAGAILGAGYAAAFLWLFNSVWQAAGRKWFPLWWENMPSLFAPPAPSLPEQSQDELAPEELAVSGSALGTSRLLRQASPAPSLPRVRGIAPAGFQAPHVTPDSHWLRLGWALIAVLLLARLIYIGSGTIQLQEDEAYQWLWSKHLALSYYSKPPLIAYTQFLGTALWGDTAFGVRFFSPIITAILSILVLRFFAREVNARAGFFLLLIITATPLAALGAVLMTVDPLSVLFWTAAMLTGWRAVQEDGKTRDWFWVGLWMGLGFLSKYTELLQWLCWAVFFVLWPPARKQLRRPAPYLALLVNLLCSFPVLLWNYQHQWATVSHVAGDAGAGTTWTPTLRFLGEFVGAEFGLLNPIFFAAMVWAAVAMWRRGRHNPRLVYFFSMGAPLFLVFLLHALRSRNYPNWIAPSVLPLLALMVVYWDTQLRLGAARVKTWLTAGLVLGFAMVLVAHNTDVIGRLTGHYLPVRFDPVHRVREWSETARVVGQARQELLNEGKPVFIIADHYGLVGQISFYLPEAKADVRKNSLVYYRTSLTPENQFYFWPGYLSRKGENAIFVRELNRAEPQPAPPPPQLVSEFESVTDMGVRNVLYHGQFLLRPLQFFACRGLK
ncbi:MAG TPA: glycosyltransferase family 39 protein [Candidatus Binatia bacterium]|jgi:membrane-associated phospholipid phosphatase|nr:glycosyltransferase family 39 protein [Candidatus Binatia bacterium]